MSASRIQSPVASTSPKAIPNGSRQGSGQDDMFQLMLDRQVAAESARPRQMDASAPTEDRPAPPAPRDNAASAADTGNDAPRRETTPPPTAERPSPKADRRADAADTASEVRTTEGKAETTDSPDKPQTADAAGGDTTEAKGGAQAATLLDPGIPASQAVASDAPTPSPAAVPVAAAPQVEAEPEATPVVGQGTPALATARQAMAAALAMTNAPAEGTIGAKAGSIENGDTAGEDAATEKTASGEKTEAKPDLAAELAKVGHAAGKETLGAHARHEQSAPNEAVRAETTGQPASEAKSADASATPEAARTSGETAQGASNANALPANNTSSAQPPAAAAPTAAPASPLPPVLQPIDLAATHKIDAAALSAAGKIATTKAGSVEESGTIHGLAVDIASKAHAGGRRFEIRLDPPELGRVDVRLEVEKDGTVTTRLMVERAETLDLLQRDSRQLERALQSSGLETNSGGLEFSLRDQSQSSRQDQQQNERRSPGLIIPDAELPPVAGSVAYGRLTGLVGGLDIQV